MSFAQLIQKRGCISKTSLKRHNLKGPNAYEFVPLVTKNWDEAPRRLLVVLESVDRSDLRFKSFLNLNVSDRGNYENSQVSILPELLDRSYKFASRSIKRQLDRSLPEDPSDLFAVSFVNYNAERSYDLLESQKIIKNQQFADRIYNIAQDLQPTDILILGDLAAGYIYKKYLPDALPHCEIKRGWVHKTDWGFGKLFLTNSIDLETLYSPKSDENAEDDSDAADKYAMADLLYFVSRNISNCLARRSLYAAPEVVPKPIYVDNWKTFNRMMRDLEENDVIGLDSETRNLESINNAIFFIQFSVCEDYGYVLPIRHPQSPWSPKDQDKIEARLREFLSGEGKEIITLNGMFDFRVARSQLKIDVIRHTVYEVTAGESILDENVGLFANASFRTINGPAKTSYQNLRNLFTYYGNDFYWTASFSKEERSTAGNLPPDTPELLDYCTMDVQSLQAIRRLQIERSKDVRIFINGTYRSFYKMFLTHVRNQMNNTAQAISHMEQDGSPVDKEYLQLLMSKKSPLLHEMQNLKSQFYSTSAVKSMNAALMKDMGRSISLFGGPTANLFDMSKRDQLDRLFFEIMQLEVVALTDSGKRSLGKPFIAAYKDTVPEVGIYNNFVKASKLMSTYVKGWHKKLMSTVDSATDFFLRPGFGFFTIVTGRLNSFSPSLQQVPSRGSLAYIIKRMFAAPPGCLNIKFDYSAHEVRVGSILSGDKKLAEAFQIGQALRKKWIVNPTDKVKEELKKKGDIHIVNVKFFFNLDVDKKHPLREGVKAVIFGVLYGKSAKTLAKDLKTEAVRRLEGEIRDLNKSTEVDASKLKEKNKELKEANAKDWEEFSEGLIEKLFDTFPDLHSYLVDSASQVEKHAHVVSPIGRVRNLWRVLTRKPGVIAAAKRRAQNSPIQGFASEIGCSSGFLILQHLVSYKEKFGLDVPRPLYNRAVHDANYFTSRYEFVIPTIHIMQYMATYGVTEWYKEIFDVEFTVEPEIEIEIGAHEKEAHKWDWSLEHLADVIFNSLLEQVNIGRLELKDLPSTVTTICEPWVDKSKRKFLQKNYPLLNVPNLDTQIEGFLTKISRLAKEKK